MDRQVRIEYSGDAALHACHTGDPVDGVPVWREDIANQAQFGAVGKFGGGMTRSKLSQFQGDPFTGMIAFHYSRLSKADAKKAARNKPENHFASILGDPFLAEKVTAHAARRVRPVQTGEAKNSAAQNRWQPAR
jgi:hypothetical protein